MKHCVAKKNFSKEAKVRIKERR